MITNLIPVRYQICMFHFYEVKQDAEVRMEIQVTERWNKSINSWDAKKD